jgi:hypothetical protein
MSRLQVVVTYADDQVRYYPLSRETGWRIDPVYRQLILGKGLPRTYIPLDSVRSYDIEEIADEQQ